MKKIFSIAILLFAFSETLYAQDTAAKKPEGGGEATGSIIKPKTADELLPHYFIDLNGFYGLGASFAMNKDLYQNAYSNTEVDHANNVAGNPKSDDSHIQSWAASLEGGKFFGEKKHFGISVGVMYSQQSGTLSIDSFHMQYGTTDSFGDKVRQVITSNRKIEEKVTITNINIPLMLHYRHQFNHSHFGVFASGGGLFGIVSDNHYNANASFDYEAIYNLKTGLVDGNDITKLDKNDLLYTKAYISNLYGENPAIVKQYFDNLHAKGYNVELGNAIADQNKSVSQKFNSVSLGVMLRGGISYQLNYRLTANLGGYYSSQTFKNNDDASYKLTSAVGSYGSIIKGSTSITNTTYGVMLGLRFFLGPDRDLDGDGVPDRKDDCPTVKGFKGDFHGCPDTDGDGILDKDDACPLAKGPICTNGCPDEDGDCVADLMDKCPHEFGLASLQGCPVERTRVAANGVEHGVIYDTIIRNVGVDTPYVILNTTVVYFDFGKPAMSESNYKSMDDAIAAMKKDGKLMLLISGYTDDVGSEGGNLVLSLKRAESVKKYFTENGVEDSRILLSGYGKKYPAFEGKSEEARRKNRRIEIKILLPVTKTK